MRKNVVLVCKNVEDWKEIVYPLNSILQIVSPLKSILYFKKPLLTYI